MSKRREKRPISSNRKARHEFEILDTVEAGISLLGSEVKSLRDGRGNLREAYVRFENGEAWLVGAHISPYEQANRNNHDPTRRRKLLLSNAEIHRWSKKVAEKGLTAIPLEMYFLGPWVKVEIGLGRGKKLHDKRQTMKERSDKREMERAEKMG